VVDSIGDQRHWRREDENWEGRGVVGVDLIRFPAANVNYLLGVDWAFIIPLLTICPEKRPL
jgi:hypothetical protein